MHNESVSEREAKKLFKKGLGKALQRARCEKGFSQKMLAEKVGIRSAYLSQIETGRRSPSPNKLLPKLASALGTLPSWLVLQAEFYRDGKGQLFGALVQVVALIEAVDTEKLLNSLEKVRAIIEAGQNANSAQ